MIVMTKKLQEIMDELKVTNSETYYHSIHVKALVVKLIKLMNKERITDYTQQEIESICKGAILHDVGKLYVKNVILTKESFLTPEEKESMIQHTRLGFEAIQAELTEEEYEIIKNICLYHHERTDGSGYEGKKDLPIYVQMVAICDVFDALHSDRVYRKGITYDKTIEIIESGGGGYFDKNIIECLKKVTCEVDG